MARILVVEDEPGIALALEDDLTMEGYQVETVGDGVLASKKAREQKFDLILLDVMLPGKDGSRCAGNCGGRESGRRSSC